ncbi:uncharacterized protein BJ171DRAFT_577073 [Polychytrium aggregatum]|uniref:uncharacterized protein n=1 Tax=Polychytrium aggregatum TaxID=110093 RepID=UPI0022FECA91|nr:uncharacterized protein BJ171DRAFT_577073 [Polychytrium aggregatum]KAI9209460.1 hypothetical protein BJ171DRAFT_577073 [Polychytrium aggregatum]
MANSPGLELEAVVIDRDAMRAISSKLRHQSHTSYSHTTPIELEASHRPCKRRKPASAPSSSQVAMHGIPPASQPPTPLSTLSTIPSLSARPVSVVDPAELTIYSLSHLFADACGSDPSAYPGSVPWQENFCVRSQRLKKLLVRTRCTLPLLIISFFNTSKFETARQSLTSRGLSAGPSSSLKDVLSLHIDTIFAVSLIVSQKYHQDNRYSNRTWSTLLNIGDVEILNRYERGFLELIEWKVHMSQAEYTTWCNIIGRLRADYGCLVNSSHSPSFTGAPLTPNSE